MSTRPASPRLGLGLAALMGTPASATPSSLAVDRLDPSPFQPRGAMRADDLAELTESIRVNGVLQPILARPHPTELNRFQIVAGERRWRAAQAAGLHEIPTLVRTLTDLDCMSAGLVENLQRTDLNAIEEAEGYRRLADEFAMTQEALARAVGKSRSHVANTMRLLHLPATVQMELRRGTLTPGHARALLAHPEPDKAALDVIARGLNVRQTEAMAAASTAVHATPDADRKQLAADPQTQAAARALSDRLGLRVDITFDGRRGTMRIHYDTVEQLDGLILLLERA